MSRGRLAAAGIGGALVVAGIVVLVVLVLNDSPSAGVERGVTLRDVVEHPRRYAGRRVTVSGEWADNERFSPANAEQVIVIGDDADVKLLVVPQLGVSVPRVNDNTVLRVTGTVRVPKRGDAGYVDTGGLLAGEDGPHPVIAAEQVRLPPGARERGPDNAARASVRELLRDPRAFDERPVIVRGTVSGVGGRGFRLTGQGVTIFVSAPASRLEKLHDGEQVRVRGELSRLSQYGAQAIQDGPPAAKTGDPYLLLRTVQPASTG